MCHWLPPIIYTYTCSRLFSPRRLLRYLYTHSCTVYVCVFYSRTPEHIHTADIVYYYYLFFFLSEEGGVGIACCANCLLWWVIGGALSERQRDAERAQNVAAAFIFVFGCRWLWRRAIFPRGNTISRRFSYGYRWRLLLCVYRNCIVNAWNCKSRLIWIERFWSQFWKDCRDNL